MGAAVTEADLLRHIARAQKTQDAAEAMEVEVYTNGGTETQARGCRRRANQALFARRKLTKQLEDLRAAMAAEVPRG